MGLSCTVCSCCRLLPVAAHHKASETMTNISYIISKHAKFDLYGICKDLSLPTESLPDDLVNLKTASQYLLSIGELERNNLDIRRRIYKTIDTIGYANSSQVKNRNRKTDVDLIQAELDLMVEDGQLVDITATPLRDPSTIRYIPT